MFYVFNVAFLCFHVVFYIMLSCFTCLLYDSHVLIMLHMLSCVLPEVNLFSIQCFHAFHMFIKFHKGCTGFPKIYEIMISTMLQCEPSTTKNVSLDPHSNK